MKNISFKLTINYGTIIGTAIVLAGIVHLFISKDATGATAFVTVGVGAILGRTWLQQRCNHADPSGGGDA
jgi:hypothetical protein